MSDPNVHRVGGLSFRAIVLDGRCELAISTDLSRLRTMTGHAVLLPSATIVGSDMDHGDILGLSSWLADVSSRVASS